MAQNKKKNASGKIVNGVLSVILRSLLALLVAMVVFAAGRGAYRFGYSVFSKKGMEAAPGRDVTVTIEEGMSTAKVAQELYNKGLIGNVWVFRAQKIFYGTGIYPGNYQLNTSMSGQQILRILASGKTGAGGSPVHAAAAP